MICDDEIEYDETADSLNNEKILLIDASALLHRSFYANKSLEEEYISGMVNFQFLNIVNKYFNKTKATKVILTFDRSNWRKEFTLSGKAVSKKVYKGHRRKDFTLKQNQLYKKFLEAMNDFEELMKNHTNVIVLAQELLEADDLIAGVCHKYGNTNNEITIITTDRDMLQLLKYPNVKIMDPKDGKLLTLGEWNNDVDWFLFMKAFRGDTSDNIEKALPGVRKTRLLKAYNDEFERAQIMEEEWNTLDSEGNGITYKVKDLFKENMTLMDLSMQPTEVKQLMDFTIKEGMQRKKRFCMFKFAKYCHKRDLSKITDNISKYTSLLGCK